MLDFATEIHAAAQTSAKPVNITAERYHYDPTRFRVTFELPKLPGQPRRRVRKVAPAGLGLEQALAWARRCEREVLQELLLGGGAPQEDRPNPPRQPLQPRPTPAKARSTEPPVPTLSEFWTRFCAEYLAKTKPGTRRGYASIFSNYLGPVLGAHRLDQIDRAALAALKKELGKLPEVSSRNQVLYKLRKIFERAIAWYILRDDQVPVIKTDKEGKKPEPVVYTEQQADRLLAAARAMGGEYSAIVLLLLHGGLRVSEVAALRWSDVDLDTGLMTIQHNYSAGEDATPKGGVAAPVGLTPELARALAALPRQGEHVLVRHYQGAQTHHTAHSVRYRLNQVQAQAGLPRTGPHLLRHSGLTILARRGCDPWRLQAHARHARIATTQRYVHLARETSAREAAAFWTPSSPAISTTSQGAKAQTRPKRPKRTQNAAEAPN